MQKGRVIIEPVTKRDGKIDTVREAFQKKKDKLGLLAQPRGGRGQKGLGVPNPLHRSLKICL